MSSRRWIWEPAASRPLLPSPPRSRLRPQYAAVHSTPLPATVPVSELSTCWPAVPVGTRACCCRPSLPIAAPSARLQGILSTLLAMVEVHGFVPNGLRTYYRNRSQPPLLSQVRRVRRWLAGWSSAGISDWRPC